MSNHKIQFDIGFNVQKEQLDNLTNQLNRIAEKDLSKFKNLQVKVNIADIEKAKIAAQQAGQALRRAFNLNLGTVNFSTFQKILSQSNQTINSIGRDLSVIGAEGKNAFLNINKQLSNVNLEFAHTGTLAAQLGQTLWNTAKWSIASTALNTITGSIQKAWGFAKSLDTSLNDIRIVTGKSADEMKRFGKEANKAAAALGASTTDYTKASLIYYQQGLNEKDVKARTEATVKAANVTGQSTAEVSEQLTAVWNGYKVASDEAELYVDKLAAVAASTASDLQELSEGMSKVASAANTMGVDIDQLTAQLSTIVSVTRQDASSVGTALKTIYARMGDLAVAGEDEFGTALGDVSGKLKQMGVDVLDQEGNLRDMGEVIEEVAGKWGDWTDAQQQAAAVALAGKRQYNNLIALFENWDMYEKALITSQDAEGTLQEQQDTYMESIKAHLEELGTAGEKVYAALFSDTDGINRIIDGLTTFVDLIGTIIDGMGGLSTLLPIILGYITKIMGTKMSKDISNFFTNIDKRNRNTETLKNSGKNLGNLALNRDYLKSERKLNYDQEIKNKQEIGQKQWKDNNTQLDIKKLEIDKLKNAREQWREVLSSKSQDQKELLSLGLVETPNLDKDRWFSRDDMTPLEDLYLSDEDKQKEKEKREFAKNRRQTENARRVNAENSLSEEEAQLYNYLKENQERDLNNELDSWHKEKEQNDKEFNKIDSEVSEAKKQKTDFRTSLEKDADRLTAYDETRYMFAGSMDRADEERLSKLEETMRLQIEEKNLTEEKLQNLQLETQELEKQRVALEEKARLSKEDLEQSDIEGLSFDEETGAVSEESLNNLKNQKAEMKKYERASGHLLSFEENAFDEDGMLTLSPEGELTEKNRLNKEKVIDDMEMAKKGLSEEDAKALEGYREALEKNVITEEEFQKALELTEEGIINRNKELDAAIDKIEKHNELIEENEDLLKDNKKQTEKVNKEIDKEKENFEDLETSIEGSEKNLADFNKEAKRKQKIEGVTTLIGGFTQLFGALSAVKNLVDVWNNQDLTFGEKMMTTFSTLIPLISAFQSISQGLAMMRAAELPLIQAEINALKEKKAVELESMLMAEVQAGNLSKKQMQKLVNIGLIDAETGAIKRNLREDEKEIAVEILGDTVRKKKNKTIWQTIGAMAAESAQAIKTGIQGFISGFTAMGPWGILLAIILALTVAMVILFAILLNQESAADKAKKKMEAANAALDTYKKNLEAAKDANEELKKSIEDYHDAQKALEELQHGTEEWGKALEDNNEKVLDLMELYPELTKYITTDAKGIMKISEEGLDKVTQQSEATIDAASAALIGQKIAVNTTTATYRREEIKDIMNYDFKEGWADFWEGAGNQLLSTVSFGMAGKSPMDSGVNTAAGINTFASGDLLSSAVVNTIIGGASSVASKNAAYWERGTLTDETLNKITNLYLESGKNLFEEDEEGFKQALAEAGIGNDAMIEALWQNKSALESSTEAQVKATEQNKLLEKQFMAASLANSELYKNTDNADAFATLAAGQKKVYEQVIDLSKYENSGKNDTNGDTNLKRDYAKAMNVDMEDVELKDGKLYIKGQEEGVDKDTAKEQIKNYFAADMINEEQISKVVAAAVQVNEGLSSVVGGEQSVALSGSLEDYVNTSGEENLRKIAEELGVSQAEAAAQLHYESAQSYINAVNTSIENMKESFLNIGNSLFGAAEKAWNEFTSSELFNKLDNDQLVGVKNAMETAFKVGGQEGLNNLTEMLQSYPDNPELAAAMAEIAAGIDWSNMTAGQEFRTAVIEAGLEWTAAAESFVKGMEIYENAAKSALKNFDKILENLQTIKEVSSEIEPGEIIDPEAFNKIKAINSEISDLFIKTSDGYKYIGSSAAELNKILKSGNSGLANVKKEMESISAAAEKYINTVGEDKITASLSVAGTSEELAARAKTMIQTMGSDYSAFVGVDQTSLEDAIALIQNPNADKSSTEYTAAKDLIKETLKDAKQTVLDFQNGMFSSTQAEEIWATEYAESLKIVKDSYEKQAISEETYQKARVMWINKYTEELEISTAKWNEYYDDLGDQQQEEEDLQILRDNYFKQELNGYRKVDNAIAYHERQLEDLEERQENLTGQDAINNYQEQIKLNQKLASDKIEYANILTEEYESNRKSFDILAKTYGITAEYDKQDRLTQETINQLETKYLELVEAGNEEEAEAVKGLIERGEAIDENVESIADINTEVQELEQSIKDLQVERFDLQLELKLDAGEAKRTLLDFKKNYINKIAETNLFGTVKSNIEAFSSYYDYSYKGATGTLADLLNQYNSAATAFNGDINLIREKQSEILEQLVDEYESAYDYITEMQEAYTESLATTQDAFDKQTEAYENINSLLENNLSLVEQVFGEGAYSKMSNFYKSMIANNERSLDLQRKQLDYWTQMKVDMDARVAAASGQEKTDLLASEEYAQIMESYVAATESYYGALETTLSTLHDDYVNSVNELFDNIAQQFTGGQSLSYISEEWDLLTKKSSKYLDNTNESYQLSKLEYNMNQSIDGFDDNIKAQERLNKLKEQELAALREKDKLTQQDIERANLSYELELKRIALEEAQNSATQMKLTRDAQGNLSYSYVEDTNNIDKLKQEVDALENQLYNFDKDRATSMYEEMLSLYQEYQNKMAEAANNPELQKLYNEQYFGDNGILTSLQTQIQELDGTFEMNKDSGLFKLVEGLKAVDLSETIQKPLNDISTEYQDKVESITSSMEKDFSNIAGHMETIISDSAAFTDAMKEQTDAIADALDRMATEFEKFSKFSLQISNLLEREAAQKAEDAETEITPIDESLNIQVKQLNAILKHFGEDEITSLDTGGYTGSWGSEGKLAVLHEKELVLNASDTENILAATQIARSLGQVFDEISKILTGDAMSYVNNHSNVMSNTNISNGQGIDQNVQIDAHFPNVTDKQEIQGAFDELINLAIQKAFEDEE